MYWVTLVVGNGLESWATRRIDETSTTTALFRALSGLFVEIRIPHSCLYDTKVRAINRVIYIP